MNTRKKRLEADRRHKAYVIVSDLYQATPWYLLPERSMLREKMRALAPVML